MAGHHTGAMLLEDIHPEDVGWIPALFQERLAPLCLQLWGSAWGLRGPAAGKSFSAPAARGGCSSGSFRGMSADPSVAAQGVSC